MDNRDEEHDVPEFVATSTSARQLFILLRCISFGDKVQLQITDEGVRFSVEDSAVMEGMAFLRQSIFSSYFLKPSQASADEASSSQQLAPFSVSLSSLLEALQIFGLSELTKAGNSWERDAFSGAFSAQTLGVSGVCRLRYECNGAPLTVTLEETGIRTTCKLVTYEPSSLAEIPFARDELTLKAIVGASYLYDAITEMAATNPEKLVISGTTDALTFSSPNDHGAVTFQFRRESGSKEHQFPTADATGHASDPTVLETFMIADEPFRQSYKFAHIAATKRALAASIKVSIRGDAQGVLSLQFMVENVDNEAGVSFVDFLFIPLVDDDDSIDEF